MEKDIRKRQKTTQKSLGSCLRRSDGMGQGNDGEERYNGGRIISANCYGKVRLSEHLSEHAHGAINTGYSRAYLKSGPVQLNT